LLQRQTLKRVKTQSIDAELRSIAKEKEHDYFALKWAGERDVNNYLQSKDVL